MIFDCQNEFQCVIICFDHNEYIKQKSIIYLKWLSLSIGGSRTSLWHSCSSHMLCSGPLTSFTSSSGDVPFCISRLKEISIRDEEDPGRSSRRTVRMLSRWVNIQKQWDNYEWKRTWSVNFILHMISTGLPLMYCPFIYAAVISWLHFLICLVIVIFHLLGKDWGKVFGLLWACKGRIIQLANFLTFFSLLED